MSAEGLAREDDAVRRPRRRRSAGGTGGRTPGRFGPQTAARIVAAAQSEFGLRGYDGARIADVAAAATIAPSAVYQYFSSKQQLYQAAYASAQDELLVEFTTAIGSADSFADRLRAVFAASARVYARSPALVPFLASLPVEMRRHPDLVPLLAERSTEFTAVLQGMFGDARAAGEIDAEVRERDLTVALMGAVIGVGLMSFGLSEPRIDPAFELLTAALSGALFGTAPPRSE
ncbi:TetR/AcrR family transcriptional regulator [Mycobacterium sp. 94-17]|uniref:TetR/AcrR family transcriptional regulator n=1 Tax=Mycobacterium sp. 94-17 TaxID=2986147 RepID=UPI002D1E698E|nr:TetR/AcrR family transcriptional regulator [Mycobacterium sp. 94-17]MEB4209550.1 TetR/AcrR family transcriptional regulator [Mycobacterium sp. 94-17]